MPASALALKGHAAIQKLDHRVANIDNGIHHTQAALELHRHILSSLNPKNLENIQEIQGRITNNLQKLHLLYELRSALALKGHAVIQKLEHRVANIDNNRIPHTQAALELHRHILSSLNPKNLEDIQETQGRITNNLQKLHLLYEIRSALQSVINQEKKPGGITIGETPKSQTQSRGTTSSGWSQYASPPTFGGHPLMGNPIFKDGVLVQCQFKSVTECDITFKIFTNYDTHSLESATLFFIPESADLKQGNDVASITWTKNAVSTNDRNHILSGAGVTVNSGGIYSLVTYHFTCPQDLFKYNVLLRAYNTQSSVTDVPIYLKLLYL